MPRSKNKKKNQQRWVRQIQSVPNINFYNENKGESIVHNNKRKKKNKKNKKKRDHYINYDNLTSLSLYQFIDQLQPLGLTIRSVECDGNSLFRAISDQLSGHESNHYVFRKEIIEYMAWNKDEFSPFYTGNFDRYLITISIDGVCGGNMELTAAAKRYKIDIIIHCFNTPRYEILYELGQPLKSIHLSYHNERNYGSVRRLDDINSLYPANTINLNKNDNGWCHNDGNINNLSLNEEVIMARTGCYDIDKIKKVLKECGDDNNIDKAVGIVLKEKHKKMEELDDLDDIMDVEKVLAERKETEELIMNDIDDDAVIDGIICCCGHKNKNDWTFCSNCGWDLRYKQLLSDNDEESNNMNGWINCKPLERKRGKKRRKGRKNKMKDDIKCNIIDNKSIKLERKYNKYRNKYWICKQCKFWNIKTRKHCMVCSMLAVIKDENNNKLQRKKNEEELSPALNKTELNENNSKIIANSWVNMAENNKSKQVKQVKQKKKNEFGWICDQCMVENKPSIQYCTLCGYGKPKKGIKNRGNKSQRWNTWICECTLINNDKAIRCGACNKKRGDVDNNNDDDDKKEKVNDNNIWRAAGSGKCHCGSGKKYKKCCKKREKHQNKSYKNKFKNIERGRNDNNYYGNNGDDAIDQLQRKILNFKGKKQDKIRMMKELDKTKNERNMMMKKVENERNIDELNDIIDGKKQNKIGMVKELDKTKDERNMLMKKKEMSDISKLSELHRMEIERMQKEIDSLKIENGNLRELSDNKIMRKQDKECIICMDEIRSYAFIPCGHLSLCHKCKDLNYEICPFCQNKYDSLIKIYSS